MAKGSVKIFVVAMLLVCAGLTNAQTNLPKPTLAPKEFCDLGLTNDLGYPNRRYNAETGSCASNQITVAPAIGENGLDSNLAYYVLGDSKDRSKLMRISLIMNMNDSFAWERKSAKKELIRVANGLSVRLLGQAPKDMPQVIQSEGSRKWEVGAWVVDVKSTVWPTGKGYDTKVMFIPRQ